MADYSKDDFLLLMKRLGTYLSVKISNIFNGQELVDPSTRLPGIKTLPDDFSCADRELSIPDLRQGGGAWDFKSVWAIAGLVVAVVFTWRLLRTPSGPQRRQPKRQTPVPSSSSANTNLDTNLLPSDISPSPEDSRTQNVINEFFQPAKPTLGQIVRQRLSEGRKVTCRLLGVILKESSPEELRVQKQATVRSSVLEVLLEITKFCDLYLMERVLDDESEKKILMALEDAGIFTSGGLVEDKVLFCSTEIGRTSFVRQLEPDWHIDTNPEITSQLARFIKYQLHISPVKPERTSSNVFSSTSLEHFFGCV